MPSRQSIFIVVGLLLGLSFVPLISACGDGKSNSSDPSSGSSPPKISESMPRLARKRETTLVLDFVPNAVHAGIYRALAADYYRSANIVLKTVEPSSTADTLKLIDSGKADFGIADATDIARQIDRGREPQAIMAVVQRPLGGVIVGKQSGIDRPKELEGKTVGVTGVPSDKLVLDTVVKYDGGDPSKVKTVTVGFNGAQALKNGKIEGFTGFWAADGTQLEKSGFPVRAFKFYEYGGPTYPGLVVFTTRSKIRQEPELMKAFLAATIQGYQDTVDNPARSLKDLISKNPTLDRELTEAQLKKYIPLFNANTNNIGAVSTADLTIFLRYLYENKLIKTRFGGDSLATNQFYPDSGETDGGESSQAPDY